MPLSALPCRWLVLIIIGGNLFMTVSVTSCNEETDKAARTYGCAERWVRCWKMLGNGKACSKKMLACETSKSIRINTEITVIYSSVFWAWHTSLLSVFTDVSEDRLVCIFRLLFLPRGKQESSKLQTYFKTDPADHEHHAINLLRRLPE